MTSGDRIAIRGPRLSMPVVCCYVDDSGSRSESALHHAARLVCRWRGMGWPGRLIVVVRQCYVPFYLSDFDFGSGVTANSGSPAGVFTMIREISERYGITVEIDDVFGWSEVAIVQSVRARNTEAVILPTLPHEAGILARWIRRKLTRDLVARNHALVVDEYSTCPPVIT